MQQELTTSKQIVEAEQRYKRMGKGRVIAQSRKVYRLVNTDLFYVESESSNDTYYFVKFKPDVFSEWYCSCKDNSVREMKCKHIFAIEFAIQWGTIKDIDCGLPIEAKIRKVATTSATVIPTTKLSYKDDDYSF